VKNLSSNCNATADTCTNKGTDTVSHKLFLYPFINYILSQRDAYTNVTGTLHVTDTLARPLHLIVGETFIPVF
jgi:hypothetical protein